MNSRLRKLLSLLLFLFAVSVINLYAQGEPAPGEPAPSGLASEEPSAGTPPEGTPLSGPPPGVPPPGEPPSGGPPPAVARPLTPEQRRNDMDIKTSTLSELAAWCRSLGLSEGGTVADLARRLREYLEVAEQTPQGEDKRKVITIESARSTEYFKIETIDEEYARLSGEVRVSLKDGDSTHYIRASDILFNRTRNIITASGGVEYKKGEGDKVETFRGESITVNLDDWSSIFLGGVSERTLQGDATSYLFAGTVISHDDEDVTVLRKARISNGNNEESLWSLHASRVWLLPGSDFAVFNAVLKVGEIPVFYIPFFFYPADEVIFHPVFGFRTREGNFVQTTTYILGRPKATSSTQSSLTKILGSSNDMEKKREGLFLRSTGKKATDPNAISLKAMLDYYANLGGYVGTELDLPAKKIMGATNFTLGFGLSRTVFPPEATGDGSYSPYYPKYDGSIDWNKSNLFSADVPFRYRFKTNSSISGKYGSLSWSLPLYSDPTIDSDFMNRAEDMDWINMIQQGADMEEQVAAQNQLGNYSWQLTGQPNPKFPNMSPYINSISISSISVSVSFAQQRASGLSTTDIKYYSPSSFFFRPDTSTLYSLSASISGTPLSVGGGSINSKTGTTADKSELVDPLKDIGVPRSPFEKNEKEDTQKKESPDGLVLPELTQRFDLPRIGNVRFSTDYRIAPSSASTLKFDYGKWKEYDDIDWNEISSILSNVGGDASTTFNLNHSEGLFRNSFSFRGNGTWRQYSLLNEKAEEYLSAPGTVPENPDLRVTDPVKVSNAKLQEYRQSFFSTSYNITSAVQPLYLNPIFRASSLQYSLGGLAVRTKFNDKKSKADDPKWDLEYGEWKKEKIDTHQLSTNLSALVMDKNQTFTFRADLPPKDTAFSWTAGLRVWVTETDANWRFLVLDEKTQKLQNRKNKWRLEPLSITERVRFGNFGNFSQTLVMDTEYKEITTLTSSLSLTKWGLSASYAVSRMLGYQYNPDGNPVIGWEQRKGEAKSENPNYKLRSRDFSLNYAQNFSMTELLNNRLNFTINLSSRLFFDFQRYTSSSFNFSLGFTIGINKFIDLGLSTNMENAYIYRYFRKLPPFNSAKIAIPDGPQNNLFLDLFRSFKFSDRETRESSGFKMKNFRISATHYLGDWNAILNWSMAPYRPLNSRQFEMNNEVSFLVQWIPITEFKSDISVRKQGKESTEWIIKQ